MEYGPSMRTLLIVTLCLYFNILPAQAGQLDNLETEATKSSSKSKSKSRSSSSSSSSNNSTSFSDELEAEIAAGIAEVIVVATVKIIGYSALAVVAGGAASNERYIRSHPEVSDNNAPDDKSSEKNNTNDSSKSFFRTQGDPILPMLRISAHWLDSGNDVSAQLNRIEAGYSFFGISYSQNTLKEDGDQLKLSNTLIHYRMTFANDFSWDLAYGRGKMNGNQEHDGSVFAMPMRFRFNPDWHFEYYPVWSSYKGGSLAEHQFSFNYHYKYIGATLGYKTWSAGDTSIDGLFTGLYLSF